MASRRLEDLFWKVEKMAREHVQKCKEHGIELLVYCTYRSPEEQMHLYMRGRKYDENKRIIVEDRSRVVTYAQPWGSFHQYRLAYDCVPLDYGKPVWDDKHPIWQVVGQLGESVGLEWGGHWKRFREYPHFQYTLGLDAKYLSKNKEYREIILKAIEEGNLVEVTKAKYSFTT